MAMDQAASFLEFFLYILISLFLFWFTYKQIQFHVWKYPPGPVGLPFVGSAMFLGKEPYKKLRDLSKKYGSFFSMSFGPSHTIIVNDYDTAKELLSHPLSLSRPENLFEFVPGQGGFISFNGEPWQEQRRFCIHTMRNLGLGRGPWEKIIQDDVVEFVEDLASLKGRPMDISEPLTTSGTSDNTALLIGRRFTKKKTNPDVQTIEKTHYILTEHFQLDNPVIAIPGLLKYFIKFNIAGYREKAKIMDDFSGIFRREIEKRLQSTESSDTGDFIGHYLEELKKHDASEGSHHFTVENLIGHMAVLFFGGSDTTIASIYWLLLLMASHPEVQEKVHQEIDDVIGRDGQAYWDDRRKLPYTMAAILEMERWVSITPLYPPRCASETFEFRGYTISKGCRIIGNGWSINRDPKHWDKPHDYLPERFLQVAGKDPSKADGYAPFSFGKRRCPGETVATMTIFLYFTGVMQKFTVKTPPGSVVDLRGVMGGVMHPIHQELCFVER